MPHKKDTYSKKQITPAKILKWLYKYPGYTSAAIINLIFIITGGLNDIVDFIQRFPENQKLYLTIIAIFLMLILCITIIVVLKKYRPHLFQKYIKPEYGIILLTIMILGYWTYAAWQTKIDIEKTRIVITEFAGESEVNAQVTQEILYQLNQALGKDEHVQIIYVDKIVAEQQGSSEARKLAKRYLADLILWGRYQYDNNGKIHITGHIENLMNSEILPESSSYKTELKDIDSVTLTEVFSQEITSIAMLTNGIIRYQNGDIQNALNLFLETISNSNIPTKVVTTDKLYVLIGNCQLMLQNFDNAEANYLNAIDIANKNNQIPFEAYYNLGLLYFFSDNPEKSIKFLSEAIDYKPDNIDSYRLRGLIYTRIWDYQDASTDLSFVINHEPTADNYILRGYMYVFLGDLDSAESDANTALKINRNSPPAYTLLGIIKLSHGDQAGASIYINKVAQLSNASNEWELQSLGPMMMMYPSDSQKAKTEQALSYLSNNLHYLFEQQSYFLPGIANFQNGNYDAALSYFDTAINIKNDDDIALFSYAYKGIILNSQGEFVNAITNFERAENIYNTLEKNKSTYQRFEGGFAFFPFNSNYKFIYIILSQIGNGLSHGFLGSPDIAKKEYDAANLSLSKLMSSFDSSKASPAHKQQIYYLYYSLGLGYEYLDCNNLSQLPSNSYENYYKFSVPLYKKALTIDPNQIGAVLRLQSPCLGISGGK
jgi:tetratricopeptide (TPR) repeat protein